MSMSLIPAFQKEFESEVVTTRKMLALVPNDKYNWKPHEKSMTIKSLATHLADIFCWFNFMLSSTELDFSKMPYQNEEVKFFLYYIYIRIRIYLLDNCIKNST